MTSGDSRIIRSKADLNEFLKCDRAVNGIHGFSDEFKYTWQYIKTLRKYEYCINSRGGGVLRYWYKLRLRRLGVLTGISLAPNSFGKGLYIPHYGSIIVNSSAKFGEYCTLQSCTNVSRDVVGGDHIFIATGAKVLSGVRIADYVIVAANAVLHDSIEEENVVVGGIPAKKISNNGNKDRVFF